MDPETLRVPLDVEWADQLAVFLRSQLADSTNPAFIESQVEGVFSAGYCRDLGLIRYAQGAPLEELRKLFRQSSEYSLEVFRLRTNEPDNDGESRPDQSLTNSRRALEALELALAAGAKDVADTLAPLIYDPPDATYIGPESEVCTPNDQVLAYSLRDYLLGKFDESWHEVQSLSPNSREESHRAAMLQGLIHNNLALFNWALSEQHARHLDNVGHPGLLNSLDDLLDVGTLAYWTLGQIRFPSQLNLESDAFLPLDLPGPQQAIIGNEGPGK